MQQQATRQWQPAKYLKFANLRMRPALELLARVPELASLGDGNDAPEILDLGAGSGNMGPAFQHRWPNARVTFVDTSEAMLEQGKRDHASDPSVDASRFRYVRESFEQYTPSAPVDLIYSNAALHWVDTDRQAQLLPKLLTFLKLGGVLAFQIPDTRAQPSHLLMREAAKQLGIADQVAHVRWVTCEREPSYYYELFKSADAGMELDMWATIYAQAMEGENPVADFTASTGLGPYVEQLGGLETSAVARAFEQRYRELIAQAYPKQPSDGRTIFNLKRFFVVAVKPLEA